MGRQATYREIDALPRAEQTRGVVAVSRALWIGVGESFLRWLTAGLTIGIVLFVIVDLL